MHLFRSGGGRVCSSWLCGGLVALAVSSAGALYGQSPGDRAPLSIDVGENLTILLSRPLLDSVSSVSVADPTIADVEVISSNQLLVRGNAVGTTLIEVFAGDVIPSESWTVLVSGVQGVRSLLSAHAEFQNVEAKARGNQIELDGVVASVEVAERALRLAQAALPEGTVVLNRIYIATSQQVNLEVQIAEVNRSVSESLGINWQAMSTGRVEQFGFRVGRLLPDALGAFPGTMYPTGQASSLFGSYGTPSGSASVRGLIDALATAGLATVLARPNITALSGETASFFSGGEYPLPSGIEQGQISFDYKKYGVLLDFLPTVIDSNRISLAVRPEVSQRVGTDALRILDAEIPVIDVRRAETTVEVGNGESIVIAGLYRNQSDTQEAGVPGLKDIPKLGLLFGNRTVRSNSTELIVVVTARLISPARTQTEVRAQQRASSGRVQGYHY